MKRRSLAIPTILLFLQAVPQTSFTQTGEVGDDLPGDATAHTDSIGSAMHEIESDAALVRARSLLEELREKDSTSGYSYSGDRMEVLNDTIILQGNASVSHKDAQLEAAEIFLERGERLAEARSGTDSSGTSVVPVLRRGAETIRGSQILYDMRTKRGTIFDARINRKKAHYSGEEIQTHSADEFHVYKGGYTTCDRPAPHFDFYSPRIKVLVDEMAIARPVFLRVNKRRLFWIPFYVFSLREDRQSGILTPSYGNRPVRFGDDQTEWEIRNLGYYLAPNEYWDLTLSSDIRQRSGWLARGRLNYAKRYRLNGQAETRLENRQDGDNTQWEWWTSLRHNQEFANGSRLRASGTFQSNRDFARDNASNLRDRLNRTLRSNITYSRRWRRSGNSLNVSARQTKNLDTDRFDTTLPDVSFRAARRSLLGSGNERSTSGRPWYSQIYYDGSARLRNRRRGTPTDTTTQTSSDLSLRISTQQRPRTWLHLNNSITESWKDSDLRGSDGPSKGVRTDRINSTLGLTQTAYGQFHPTFWRITALRHVMKPNVSLRYKATRTETGGTVGFGGSASPWQQSRQIGVRLDNTFWIKLLRNEEEEKIRLAQLVFSTSYNFDADSLRLADLVTTLRINAGRSFESRLTTSSELYDDNNDLQLLSPRLRRFELNSSFRIARSRGPNNELEETVGNLQRDRYDGSFPSDRFGYESGLQSDLSRRDRAQRFQLNHYYSQSSRLTSTVVDGSKKRITSKRSWLRTSLGASIRSRWHLQYSLNYNLRAPGEPLFATDRITSELLSVQREFHDWTATFNVEPNSFHRDRTFFLKAQFKDIPQIKFERGDRRL